MVRNMHRFIKWNSEYVGIGASNRYDTKYQYGMGNSVLNKLSMLWYVPTQPLSQPWETKKENLHS